METARSVPRRRFRFALRQLLIAVTAFRVLLGLWMLFIRKELTIRPAEPADAIASPQSWPPTQTQLRSQ